MKRASSGQALLVMLLVLGVVITTALSLVARLTTDISLSENEVRSGQAFEAAEAGVEEALRALEAGEEVPSSLSLSPGGVEADVNIQLSELKGASFATTLSPGEAATFWLNSFSLNGENFPSYEEGGTTRTLSYNGNRVKICWNGDRGSGHLEAAVYYQEGSSYRVARFLLNDAGACGDDGFGFGSFLDLPASSAANNKFINVRFYGGSDEEVTVAAIGVDGDLPRQGTVITSEAVINNTARRVVVSRGWPVPPSFFDFTLFSGGNLSK